MIQPAEWEIRASDAEREAAVAVFREAYVAGRLSLGEVCDRAGSAYSAKTRGELYGLVADLAPGWDAGRPDSDQVIARSAVTYRGPERSIGLVLLAGLVLFIVAIGAQAPGAMVPLLIVFASVLMVARWSELTPSRRCGRRRSQVGAGQRPGPRYPDTDGGWLPGEWRADDPASRPR